MNAVTAILFTLVLGPWSIAFDESSSQLKLENKQDNVTICGKLSFESGKNPWRIVLPRDNVPQRLAIVDSNNNVQGYISFQQEGNSIDLLFHHRTRQFYFGSMSFDGEITFRPDSFPCQTTPQLGQNVLTLGIGHTDSKMNDSIFAREEDLALVVKGANRNIVTQKNGRYSVHLKGRIEEASESVFGFQLKKHFLQTRYIPYYTPINRKRCPSPPTGWMSWNVYFDKATAEDNLAEARVGKKYLQPFGMEFWSIESWQGNSDQLPVSNFYNTNLETNEKQFPKGMKQLAKDIRALGFRPGIWMAPYGTGNKEFYDAHKDWFLHDKNGKPMRTWNGVYTLDPTNKEVLDHLRKIFKTAADDWGYEFFKVDGMSGSGSHYCAHFFERPEVKAAFKDPNCKNPFEQTVRVFREGIGPNAVLLACQGHATGPEVAFADASRIGSDIVHPNKPVGWANLTQQAGRTLNQIFAHNIVFFADPDTLLVNDALSMEEARLSTTVVSLPGQMMFAGDKLGKLPMERMRLLQQALPVADVHPMNLYPFFNMLPVWDLKVALPFLKWDDVALFNWTEENSKIEFNFKELGLDPTADYLVYEFWTNKFLGTAKETFSMDVPRHGVRLLAVHPLLPCPQFVSSDRHVTQGAVDLTSLDWSVDKKAITGSVKLVEKNKTTLRFHVPDNFKMDKVTVQEKDVQVATKLEAKGKILALSLVAPKTQEAKFAISFK